MNEPMSKERREALLTEARKFGSATLTPAGLEQLLSTAERIERLDEKYHEEKLIVDRIWKMLGCTTYADVKGKSIYELIEDIHIQLATVTKERDELKRVLTDLKTCVLNLPLHIEICSDGKNWWVGRPDQDSTETVMAQSFEEALNGFSAAMQKEAK